MSVNEVHDPSGEVTWDVRWWEAGRPRRRVFGDRSDADAFQKEIRQRRRVTTLRILTLVIAALAFLVGVVLLWDMRHREPVPAAFTRVGGATRVETAIEASRFWFASRPQFVVTARQDASQEVLWRAAWCAVAHNAPLLLTPTKATRGRGVKNTIESWPSHPTQLKVPDPDGRDCRATDRVHAPKRLWTLEVASASVLPKRLTRRKKLAPLVVFAAAKTPSSAPDVAVGLALAAHLARQRDVSLVVIPRYLQADRELEHALRVRNEVIEDGVVLGQSGILSEDVRTLLRQVITSSNRKGILGEVRTTLGSLAPVIAALLVLLGVGAAARAATELAQESVGRTPPQAESLTKTPVGRKTMTFARALRIPGIPPGDAPTPGGGPQADLPTDRALTIEMHWGPVTGVYAGGVDVNRVPFLKLKDARLEPPCANPKGVSPSANETADADPQAVSPSAKEAAAVAADGDPPAVSPFTDESEPEYILLPVAEIKLITVPRAPAAEDPQV